MHLLEYCLKNRYCQKVQLIGGIGMIPLTGEAKTINNPANLIKQTKNSIKLGGFRTQHY